VEVLQHGLTKLDRSGLCPPRPFPLASVITHDGRRIQKSRIRNPQLALAGKPPVEPGAALWAKSHAASNVFGALEDMAAERGSPVITPTRQQLMDTTGVRKTATISAALTALEQAGWIDRVHVPVMVGSRQTATVLRVVLRRRCPSTALTGTNAVAPVKRHKGRCRLRAQDSSYGRERNTPALNAGGVAQAPSDTGQLLQQGLEMDKERKLRAQQRQAAQQEDAELAKRLGFVDLRELQELTDMLDDHWLKAEPT